jgi:hypothetical protein
VELSLSVPVVLHKHQIPDLDIPIEVIIFATWGPAGDIRAMIVKNF